MAIRSLGITSLIIEFMTCWFSTFASSRACANAACGTATPTVPAVRENPVISLSALRSNLFLRPVELGSVDPHAMQDDCELARDSDTSPFRRRMLALSAWHAQNVAVIIRKVRFMSLACWSH